MARIRNKLFKQWIDYFLLLSLGALFPLAFAPLNWWFCAALSIWGWLLATVRLPTFVLTNNNRFVIGLQRLQPRSVKQVFWRSWFYGMGVFVVGIFWLHIPLTIDHIVFPLAIFVMVLCSSLLAFWFALQGIGNYFSKLYNWLPLLLPSIWVLQEWFRSWVLTGFPWLYLGYTSFNIPLIIHLAPIGGVFLVSWITICCLSLVVWLLLGPNRLRLIAIVAIFSLIFFGLQIQSFSWVDIDSSHDSLNVSLIQGNIPQERKWLPEELPRTKSLYRELTLQELQQDSWKPQVIIWPEAAIPQFYQEAADYFEAVTNELVSHQSKTESVSLITGISTYQILSTGKEHYYNSLLVLGSNSSIYHKQRLVPFGEFTPLQFWLEDKFLLNFSFASFTKGGQEQSLFDLNHFQLAPLICYEVVYPEFVRQQSRSADILLTVSNDAWFGRSWGPHQHFQMARMRAIEMGRPLIRGTNTGITAVVDHHGQVVAELPQFQTDVLRYQVPKVNGITPFSQFGSWPIITLSGIIFLLYGLLAFRAYVATKFSLVSISTYAKR